MTEVLTVVGLLAISLYVHWITRPDPQVVKQTKERKEMLVREESSSRWDV